jgi:hypothetical protein
LALPHRDHPPSKLAELPGSLLIPLLSSPDFFPPPFGACFRQAEVFAPFVTVPEAAVDKNHRLVIWQNNVGLAGELFVLRAVDGETIAHGVQDGSHHALGLRVFAADAAHVPGAALGREAIVQFSIWDLACYHFQTRPKKEPLMDRHEH